ncbi:MAG TPA: histidine--tRNA ligase [Actinomycetales bacterium]|nr:histidine--tRNA ligase [Actinomycetales bacterium]
MARPKALSGFPEWLPAQRLIEQELLAQLQRVFELHGYVPLETRAVEPLEHLLAKGETSKEVYLLRRLQDEAGDEDAGVPREHDRNQLGLHFDLTVPLARYVLENAGKLQFPFKRYQMQKVWRGERPQDGRFREFYQVDIDVVGADTLPYHFEVEVPLVMAKALAELPIPPIRMRINNRKVAEGFYRGLGLQDTQEILRQIDKLAKIGADAVAELLQTEAGADKQQARACLELAQITGQTSAVVDDVRALAAQYEVESELLETGLTELAQLLDAAQEELAGIVIADLSVARGLDYYTGSVYETEIVGHEDLGSVCSGGRYDELASDGKNTYPGVGMSIGLSRLISRLFRQELVTVSRSTPTAVLVAVGSEDERSASNRVANQLRERGIAAETSPSAAKFGRQIRYADRRGIPFVWFIGAGDDGADQVKDIRSGDQHAADASSWQPPADDLYPRITAAEA